MAHILDNPAGGRRMIRLTSDDVMMVVSRLQSANHPNPLSPDALREALERFPVYLPEEVTCG